MNRGHLRFQRGQSTEAARFYRRALTLSRRARELHRDLRACGLSIDVSYSVRRRTGGLKGAAARADAALDTALARRSNR